MKKNLFVWVLLLSLALSACISQEENQEEAQRSASAPERIYINYIDSGGAFELPVNGATGYASLALNVRAEPTTESEAVALLDAGQAFQVCREFGDWWEIETGETRGWVMHQFCLINLPDIIPSIVYSCTNAEASKFRSSGREIPEITGQKLYDAYFYNERLHKKTYILPVLYSMAPKLCAAQQRALSEGNTLVLYEGFRPYGVQQRVVAALSRLAEEDAQVKAGITSPPWSMGWFISRTVSNHQKGYAIDVSVAKVDEITTAVTGDYVYTQVNVCSEYEMPTPIHELSAASASMSEPVPSKSAAAWREASLSEGMNAPALLLRDYCSYAGLTPLASEWWHFNDLETAEKADARANDGNYDLDVTMSVPPAPEGHQEGET